MKEIMKVFESKEFGNIRTTIIDDEPYFMLSDVCRVLEIKNSRDSVSRLSSKGVANTDTPTNGGIQKATFISESNLYKLSFTSRKPQAEKFTDWVTSEVLPSIRKTGSYSLDIPKTLPEALRAYADEVEAHAETKKKLTTANDKIKHDAPLVGFASHIACTADSISVGDFAKIIYNDGITLGRNKLFEWLRNNKLLMKDNTPYQQYIDNGIFTVKEGTFNTVYGDRLYTKTLITGKCQIYITERIKEESDAQ